MTYNTKMHTFQLDYEDWPAIGKTSNGEFEVTVVSETKLSHFTIKALSVTNFKVFINMFIQPKMNFK